MTQAYVERYGSEPVLWSRAPGRVDLMGSHTDYNQGYVMTMTIDRDTWIAFRPRQDGRTRVYSLDVAGGGEFAHDDIVHDAQAPWTNYIRGLALILQQAGYELTGFDGLIHSTIPFGSGLSSSAAIEMATAAAYQMTSAFAWDAVEMALLAQRAENQFVGVPCGILDQYSSAMGRKGAAILLDCRTISSRIAPIAEGISIVICDTCAQRHLAGTEYESRRTQCEEGVRLLQQTYPELIALRDVSLEQFEACAEDMPDVIAKRCRFIIEENQRVLDLADALGEGDRARLGQLCAASYAGARDLYEISVQAMQQMMDAMLTATGVIGARQAGAGFGGCMVALVDEREVDAFSAHVQERYLAVSGIEPRVYPVRAAQGAGPLA